MSNDRHIKREQLLHEMVAQFVQHEANTDPLITITRVHLTPDFRKAIVFATTIPDGREEDAVVFLKRNGTALRDFLKRKARMKHIPHLEFMVDAGEKHRQHIDKISSEIKAQQNSSESNTGREVEL